MTRVPWHLDRAIGLAIQGEHMIRYTRQDLLPRLQFMDTVANGSQLQHGSAQAV